LLDRYSDRGVLHKDCNEKYKKCRKCTILSNNVSVGDTSSITLPPPPPTQLPTQLPAQSPPPLQRPPSPASVESFIPSILNDQQDSAIAIEFVVMESKENAQPSIVSNDVDEEESGTTLAITEEEKTIKVNLQQECSSSSSSNNGINIDEGSVPRLIVPQSPCDEEPPEALMECLLDPFRYSMTNGVDEDQVLETSIKQLTQFHQFECIDINYQGESIHAMFNEEGTHIGLMEGSVELSSFCDRRGKVFYITDKSPTHNSGEVMVVVAWKLDPKDTFGFLQTLSFDKYVSCLETR